MDVPAVILCGGLGTRLREETEYRPKPMVEVGGKPILWHVMKIYAEAGIRRFILCLGYKGRLIKEYFLNYRTTACDFTVHLGRDQAVEIHAPDASVEDWSVTCAETGLTAQTGARVRRALEHVKSDTFCLTYGDGLADVDVGRLLDFHRAHGRVGTLTAVRPPGRFGELSLDDEGLVSQFSEKPRQAAYMNGGFFVFDTERLRDHLPEGDDVVLEREPLEGLARAGELVAYRHDGFWQCMDTHREWTILNDLWTGGRAAWATWLRP